MADTLNRYQSNLTAEQVDQALHKIGQVDDSIAQAQAFAEQAGQYAQSINPAGFAPKSHADSSAQYGKATGSLYGHVKLSDAPGESGAEAGVAATPAGVRAALAPVQVIPEWQGGFSDAGPTRIWRIGEIVVCQFSVVIPTISSPGWINVLTIPGVEPNTLIQGRSPTVAGGEARDWQFMSGGIFQVYLETSDSGNQLRLPLVFVSAI